MTSSSEKLRSQRRRLRALGVVAGALGSLVNARAAEPLALTWRAPAGCPQEAAVRARIDALVPAAASSKERLRADGAITRVAGRFRLKLVMRVGELRGERQIDADSCQDLAGAAAVALGLMLQSAEPTSESGGERESESGRERDSSSAAQANRSDATNAAATAKPIAAQRPPPLAEEPLAEEPEAVRKHPSERDWALSLHGLAALDIGPFPSAAFGGAVGAGLVLRDWRVFLDFQVGSAQSLSVESEPGLSADVSRIALESWLCRAFRADPFELSPCLTVGLERVTASGTGSGTKTQSASATWVSAGAGAFGRWYVTDFLAVLLGFGAKFEGARPHIVVEGLGEVDQLRPAAFWLKAGPEWIF